MISKGDDYPIHQTPEPVQQVFTSDRNFYDRFFFNGYFREGEPYFAAAMGIYPNVGIIDAAFSVIVGGVQHCVRASRMLGHRSPRYRGRSDLDRDRDSRCERCACVSIMQDIKADLMFEARAACDRGAALHTPRSEIARLMMDLTRFTQHGGYSGKLTVAWQDLRCDAVARVGVARSLVGRARNRHRRIRREFRRDPGVGAVFLVVVADQLRGRLHSFRRATKIADGSRWHEFGAIAKTDPGAALDIATGGRLERRLCVRGRVTQNARKLF